MESRWPPGFTSGWICACATCAREAGVNAVGFAPKLSLLEDRLALAVPVGFAFGEGCECLEDLGKFHPTLLFTQQLAQRADLNLSAKSLIRLEGRPRCGGSTSAF